MMIDAQKNKTKLCPYKISITIKMRCNVLQCQNECKKKFPPTGSGICSDSKGICDCNAPCKGSRYEYNTQSKIYITFLTINV